MAKGKTINIPGVGRSSGYIKFGNRKSYLPGYRKPVKFSAGNYSTTDRTRFSARLVVPVTLMPITTYSSTATFDNKLYGFINIYECLYYSQYRNMIVRMYEEFTIKDYNCKITLDGQGTLVNANTPQTTFYLAQDRNGVPAGQGFKRPTDYASVVSRAINYYSPFSQYCWNSVSGLQEKSSFISCDLFKPETGLFSVSTDPNKASPLSFLYNQNQTYSQYMFKPVVLLAVNSSAANASPKFNVEIRINIVGRGIRALTGEPSPVGITGENVAQPSDVSAGKVFYNQNGDSYVGTSLPPVKTPIVIEQNGNYPIDNFTGGYDLSHESTIEVNVANASQLSPVNAAYMYGAGATDIHLFNRQQWSPVQVEEDAPYDLTDAIRLFSPTVDLQNVSSCKVLWMAPSLRDGFVRILLVDYDFVEPGEGESRDHKVPCPVYRRNEEDLGSSTPVRWCTVVSVNPTTVYSSFGVGSSVAPYIVSDNNREEDDVYFTDLGFENVLSATFYEIEWNVQYIPVRRN